MVKRTRLFLSLAAAVVVVGVGTALIASYFGFAPLSLAGPAGSQEFKYIPTDARVVAFADVRRIMSSELRQKVRGLGPAGGDRDFQARTGINPETDITYVVVALVNASTEGHQPLVLARGRFNAEKIDALVRERGGRAEDFKGRRILTLAGDGEPAALTFPETGLMLFGEAAAVRQALDTRGGSSNVSGNAELMRLVKDVDGSSVWAVGRFDALAGAGPIPPNVADQLPAINLFSASGEIDSSVHARLRAEARDTAAAQNLRQVIQGFVALGRMQAGSNAALAGVLNTVVVAGDGATVALTFTIPPDAFDLLTPRRRPREQAAARF